MFLLTPSEKAYLSKKVGNRPLGAYIREELLGKQADSRRIDCTQMKAIPLPFSKMNIQDVSSELYFDHGGTMPKGSIPKNERSPNNFTMAQWQQAKRIGKDPRTIK